MHDHYSLICSFIVHILGGKNGEDKSTILYI